MIESFSHLEQLADARDLADVFLETDEQEHGVPAAQILEALRKRREVMRDCVERGKNGGLSMGKLVGNEAKKLNEAFQSGRTFLDPLTIKAELYALAVMGDRKSTRLNSSHVEISYAVFCLKKKKTETH